MNRDHRWTIYAEVTIIRPNYENEKMWYRISTTDNNGSRRICGSRMNSLSVIINVYSNNNDKYININMCTYVSIYISTILCISIIFITSYQLSTDLRSTPVIKHVWGACVHTHSVKKYIHIDPTYAGIHCILHKYIDDMMITVITYTPYTWYMKIYSLTTPML